MRKTIRSFVVLVLAAAAAQPSFPQSKKPALIRDTDVAEGKEDVEADKPKEHNPFLAEKSFAVGEFYYKRKNYVGAIERYLEALEYQPEMKKAYRALDRAFAKAIEVDQTYIRRNPSAPDIKDKREKLAKLEKQHAELKTRMATAPP